MRGVLAFLIRLGGVLTRRRREGDFDDEIASHFQLHIEDNLRAGMSPAEARRDALLKFGGIEKAREEYRDRRSLPMLETLRQDLRHGVRMLWRTPSFTLVVLAVLALGIGANTAIFSVTYAVLLRPLPFHDPARLAILSEGGRSGSRATAVSAPDILDFAAQNQVFESLAGFQTVLFNVTSGDAQAERIFAARISATMFPLLGAAPAAGRQFTREEDAPGHPVVILSDGFWRRRFGANPGILGQAIQLNGRAYTVIGVMPRSFTFPVSGMPPYGTPAELWVPMAFSQRELNGRGDNFNIGVLVRLKRGVTLERANQDVSAIVSRIHETYPADIRAMIKPNARVSPLDQQITGNVRTLLLVLLGAVTCLLLISCANVANLLLARSAVRQREIAIRGALGASRRRIVRQLLIESLLLSCAGGALGLLLARAAGRALVAAAPGNIPRLSEVTVDPWVLAFCLLVSLATGVLFGLAPALSASRRDFNLTLKEAAGGGSAGLGRLRARSFLVGLEVALAVVLVAGAGLLVRSLGRLLDVDPGFDPRHALSLSVTLPASRYPSAAQISAFYDQLLERAAALPGVSAAGVGTSLPMGVGWTIVLTPEGIPPRGEGPPVAMNTAVTYGYFAALGIPLRAGRFLNEFDRAGTEPVIVVNEALARQYWGSATNAIDKRMKWGPVKDPTRPWMRIVGVVKDVKQSGLVAAVQPGCFLPLTQFPAQGLELGARTVGLIVRSESKSELLAAALRREVAALDRQIPAVGVGSMEQLIQQAVGPRRFNATLLSIFAGLAVLLAATGIYGVIAYTVAQRTREIGIRMALGAGRPAVMRSVMVQSMTVVVVGAGAGILIAIGVSRFLEGLLFEIRPTDPLAFGGAVLILLAAALLASYTPARRATRIDPMRALRYE